MQTTLSAAAHRLRFRAASLVPAARLALSSHAPLRPFHSLLSPEPSITFVHNKASSAGSSSAPSQPVTLVPNYGHVPTFGSTATTATATATPAAAAAVVAKGKDTADAATFGVNMYGNIGERGIVDSTVWQNIVDGRRSIDVETANVIAGDLLKWAMKRGATGYAHWFQPLGGPRTGEKHESFLDFVGGKPTYRFTGMQLLRGEADGSSFPSGHLRETSAARALMSWDPTSPPFVYNATLYIPSVFYSWETVAVIEKEEEDPAHAEEEGDVTDADHYESNYERTTKSSSGGRGDSKSSIRNSAKATGSIESATSTAGPEVDYTGSKSKRAGSKTAAPTTTQHRRRHVSLDHKLPLKRSMEALEKECLKLLRTIGDDTKHTAVKSHSGIEQEFFLVPKTHYESRQDLRMAGRTLFGSRPPRHQQLEDQYYSHVHSHDVKTLVAELQRQLWQLGLPIQVCHKEVAPAQYEVALRFADANLATDQNLLFMLVLRDAAERHGFAVLFHEKPFAGINGSGKHNNWSFGTDCVPSLLLDPLEELDRLDEIIQIAEHAATSREAVAAATAATTTSTTTNKHAATTTAQATRFAVSYYRTQRSLVETRFMACLASVLCAVDTYAPMLRLAVSGAGNDRRLGGCEAPPAIMSVYLGDQLLKRVVQFCSDALRDTNKKDELADVVATFAAATAATGSAASIGAKSLASLVPPTSDRNRTSPFAFTGNKFEFRAVGSSHTPSVSNTVINVAVADAMRKLTVDIATEIATARTAGAPDASTAKHKDAHNEPALASAAIKKMSTTGNSASGSSVVRTVATPTATTATMTTANNCATARFVIATTLMRHMRVVFNGDGYSEQWVETAKQRGLPNYQDTNATLRAFYGEPTATRKTKASTNDAQIQVPDGFPCIAGVLPPQAAVSSTAGIATSIRDESDDESPGTNKATSTILSSFPAGMERRECLYTHQMRDLFSRHGVMVPRESAALLDVWLSHYAKTLLLEAETACAATSTVASGAVEYMAALTLADKTSLALPIDSALMAAQNAASRVASLLDAIRKSVHAQPTDLLADLDLLCDAMARHRDALDALESVIPDRHCSYPKYATLLQSL